MFEDPKALTGADWHNIHMFLQWFWIYLPIVLTFGITMLIAHALIPSLIITGQLPESAHKARLPLTGIAAIAFAAGVVILSLAINAQLDVQNIWPRVFV